MLPGRRPGLCGFVSGPHGLHTLDGSLRRGLRAY
ncbi:MAG: hypothetical protein MAG453_00284 [Calditrichaeota bacterium]|nr:hypothetical protein [Calditrichota bacterium]